MVVRRLGVVVPRGVAGGGRLRGHRGLCLYRGRDHGGPCRGSSPGPDSSLDHGHDPDDVAYPRSTLANQSSVVRVGRVGGNKSLGPYRALVRSFRFCSVSAERLMS